MAQPSTIDDVLRGARRRLRGAPFAPSGREANLLLAHALSLSEAQVIARQHDTLPEPDRERFESLLGRRLAGEPVAYVVGYKEFFGRPYAVDRRVLIPRPETEHLVEAALQLALPTAARIADLGTGSGCIACSLALELPAARLIATDRSPGALAVAHANRLRHRVRERVALAVSDLATSLDLQALDLVVSNPPYIAGRDGATLSPEIVDYEPHAALFAGEDGSVFLRRLLTELAGLRSGTWVLLEIGSDQPDLLARLSAGTPFDLVEIRRDYSGQHRIALLRHE